MDALASYTRVSRVCARVVVRNDLTHMPARNAGASGPCAHAVSGAASKGNRLASSSNVKGRCIQSANTATDGKCSCSYWLWI